MPTVTNFDVVLGGVPWGTDRSDARAGINMLLFDNGGSGAMPGAASMVPQEHAYAAAMVSANAYYGYHRQHQDCSMDTSESSLPASGPSHPGLGLNPNNGQHQHQPSRKRRPTGPGLGNAHDEEDDAAVSVKRTKCCAGENVYGHTDDIHSDISGGFLKSAKKSGGKIQLRIMEDSELDALESLLKHTHGCDYYNFEGCEL